MFENSEKNNTNPCVIHCEQSSFIVFKIVPMNVKTRIYIILCNLYIHFNNIIMPYNFGTSEDTYQCPQKIDVMETFVI